MIARALPWLTAATFAALIPWVAGLNGIAYAPFWLLAAAPGVLLGRSMAGRHAFGLVAGLAIGYTTSCLVVWALIATGWMSPRALSLALAAEVAALWLVSRSIARPVLDLPPWTPRDRAALAATLLLVPLLMAAPYRNLGAANADGTKHYRAYFTADFVWHAALTAELSRFEMPPRNPYMARESLHYYWTYFLVPAAVSSAGPPMARDVEAALKVNAIATATVLIAAFFLLAWSARGGAVPAALAVLLVVVAASAEGAIAIKDLLQRGAPLAALRDINVDAITAWKYNGLRIDGVHRTMFYTPQHGLSCALGLLALVPAALSGATGRLGAIAVSGLLLGLAATLNPFLGAAFSLIYGLAIFTDAVRIRASIAQVLRHSVAAVPPVVAVLWGTLNAMGDGAGDALTIGWAGHARHAPIVTLLMSLGPVLVPALAGLVPGRRLPTPPVIVAMCGLVVGLGLLYFVVLSDASWVGFRAGQILLAVLTIPLARVLATISDRSHAAMGRGLAAALVAGILALGAPTVVADTRNASDIANLSQGPGFPWTLTVTRGQQDALAWVKQHTPPTAIVQMDALARGRGHWSFIPTFAGRRMAAGLPISLLPRPEYQRMSGQVRTIFDSRDPAIAHQGARRMGIDYLWVDAVERRAYPKGAEILATSPGYFTPVFDNGEVRIYRVR
ncbi:MAG: hypothetical protein JJE40_14910 [Vicinamibacteria bacterium]|nr:hypothetical protein [Vicinamibacteria bacterium]